jgi:hypothetical protein
MTLALTNAALLLLHGGVLVLAGASVTATVTRYLGLRFWVFTRQTLGVEGLRISTD